MAARAIKNGNIVAHPTEGVWGLACNPLNQMAVMTLCALKQRPIGQGLILIANNIEQLTPWLKNSPQEVLEKLASPTQSATTWVIPLTPESIAPSWITKANSTLAVRITQHQLSRKLINACGHPLVSTSANPKAKPPALTGLTARKYFKSAVTYLHGELSQKGKPSKIIHIENKKILRP